MLLEGTAAGGGWGRAPGRSSCRPYPRAARRARLTGTLPSTHPANGKKGQSPRQLHWPHGGELPCLPFLPPSKGFHVIMRSLEAGCIRDEC
jgi:hypothetical protein